MDLDDIKQKIETFHQNGQVINAAYWLLKSIISKNKNFKGFEFRENAKPEFILMTTEDKFGKFQIIEFPKNTFEFPLELMLVLIAHEMVHVNQKSQKPFVLDKNEREWQAYYEMIFPTQFPQIPEISNSQKILCQQRT